MEVSFRIPTIEEVEFEIECFPEDMQIEGNASCIDEATDKKIAKSIRASLRAGNEWAWCRVKVTAKFRGVEGIDHLGGCSYKSEKDFIKCNDYYADMKSEAYADLVKNLKEMAD